jgi:hypothetical protein
MRFHQAVLAAAGAAVAGAGTAVAMAARRRIAAPGPAVQTPAAPEEAPPPEPPPEQPYDHTREQPPALGDDPQAALDAARARLRARAEELARELDEDPRPGDARGR